MKKGCHFRKYSFAVNMSKRMVLRSGDCKQVYPDNKTCDFRVLIPKPLQLTGNWTVSLLELAYQGSKIPTEKDLYICCNLCRDTIVGDSEIPLLRRLFISKRAENLILSVPYGIPLKINTFQEIHVYIMTSKNELASFLAGQLTVTLQLQKKPF